MRGGKDCVQVAGRRNSAQHGLDLSKHTWRKSVAEDAPKPRRASDTRAATVPNISQHRGAGVRRRLSGPHRRSLSVSLSLSLYLSLSLSLALSCSLSSFSLTHSLSLALSSSPCASLSLSTASLSARVPRVLKHARVTCLREQARRHPTT